MPDQSQYRIVSDGTPSGTKVFNPDGSLLKHVKSVNIEMANGYRRATIEVFVFNPIIDLAVDGRVSGHKTNVALFGAFQPKNDRETVIHLPGSVEVEHG